LHEVALVGLVLDQKDSKQIPSIARQPGIVTENLGELVPGDHVPTSGHDHCRYAERVEHPPVRGAHLVDARGLDRRGPVLDERE